MAITAPANVLHVIAYMRARGFTPGADFVTVLKHVLASFDDDDVALACQYIRDNGQNLVMMARQAQRPTTGTQTQQTTTTTTSTTTTAPQTTTTTTTAPQTSTTQTTTTQTQRQTVTTPPDYQATVQSTDGSSTVTVVLRSRAFQHIPANLWDDLRALVASGSLAEKIRAAVDGGTIGTWDDVHSTSTEQFAFGPAGAGIRTVASWRQGRIEVYHAHPDLPSY